jgi:hypothetical protein
LRPVNCSFPGFRVWVCSTGHVVLIHIVLP